MKKISKIFILILIIAMFPLINFTSYAGSHDVIIRDVTEEELQQALDSESNRIQPRVATCCDNRPSLVWKQKEMWHIYPNGGGKCSSHAYVGNQVCSRCGSVWKTNTIYKQTAGCGKTFK